MPSNKPRITLRLDQENIDWLENWAKEEFLTIPQLARVIVKRAIAEYLKRHSPNASMLSPIAEQGSIHRAEIEFPSADESNEQNSD